MRRPRAVLAGVLAVLILAALIHLDWHLARPHQMRMSAEWRQHWVLAIPIFAILAYSITAAAPRRPWVTSALIILGAVGVAQVLEPLHEVLVYHLPWDTLGEGIRWTAFSEFMAAGLLTYLPVMAGCSSRSGGAG